MRPDFEVEIRGMAEYHVRLFLSVAKPFIEAEQPAPYEGTHIMDLQQQRYRWLTQLVEDAVREAFFKGATAGLSLASTTKYMVVTAAEKEAIMARIGEESDA